MSKRKVNINRPNISSEEIISKKNFSSVLSGVKKVYKPYYKKPWVLNSVLVTTVVVITTAVLMNNNSTTKVVTANDTTQKTVTNSYTYEPKKETMFAKLFVDPPIKNADIPYTSYKVSAVKNSEIKHNTGTKIKIPTNAFVDEKGNPVKGDVEIKYREFHDIADVYLSGIPMTYDSAGEQFHFETAGMMDIKGFQNDKPVFIAPGKKLDFEMKSTDNRDMFNLYSLDTTAKNWNFIEKNKIKKADDLEVAKSDTIKANPEMEKIHREFQPKIEKAEKELIVIKKDITKIETTQPIEPRKMDASKFNFNLEVNAKEYPELAVYKDVQFEVNDDSFESKYYKVVWDDAKISKGNNKLTYKVTLIKGKEEHTFNVQPALQGKTYENAKVDFDSKFEKYGTTLTKRKDDEAKKLREIDSLNKVMAANQKLYNERSAVAYSNSAEVFRLFSIEGFGTYNCDSPQKYPRGANVIAKFITEDGKSIALLSAELAEKGRNAIFGYTNFNNFNYNPKAKNIIWAINNHGDFVLGKINPNDPRVKDGSEQTIIMTIYKDKIKSSEDLKKLLEI